MSIVDFMGRGRGNRLGTLKEDLHADYGNKVKAHIIDGVLDAAIAEREDAALKVFATVFIERDARERLDAMAAQAEPGMAGRVTLPAAA